VLALFMVLILSLLVEEICVGGRLDYRPARGQDGHKSPQCRL
jgi:hypothetical protein